MDDNKTSRLLRNQCSRSQDVVVDNVWSESYIYSGIHPNMLLVKKQLFQKKQFSKFRKLITYFWLDQQLSLDH